jgi:hypothetical protein
VSLGGFGSVPGALVAGLLIGVIESLSAYWIGAVYKDIVVYSLFLRLPLVPAAGPDGQDVMRALSGPRSRWRWCIAYPLLFSTPFQQRLGALVLLLCDRGLGLEHRRRLCRAGLGRPRRVLRLRRLCRAGVYAHFGCRRWSACRRHRDRLC